MNNLYEQKYKEALEKAREIYKEDFKAMWLENLFPELKESEDEKIRKQILSFLKEFESDHYRNLDFSSWIAWLEKQGECVIECPQNHQDSNRPSGGIVLEDFNGGEGFYKLNLAYLNKKQVEEVEEMVREWNNEPSTSEEDIKDCIGLCLTDADEQRFKNYHTNLRDCLAWLEKQGEKCAIVWHSISEEPDEQEELLCEWESEDATWHDIAFYHADTKTFWDGEIQVENVTRWCYINDLLKNQGKQKTTDVELRFKVGDWVVNKYGYGWHVDSFDKKNCQVSNGEGDDCYFKISKQDEFHLWTIDDAKDGDVLVWDNSNCIALFKKVYDKESFLSHGSVGHITGEFESRISYHDIAGVHPATKEQRVLLFQKMKEAGYEWDYIDKKVLKID